MGSHLQMVGCGEVVYQFDGPDLSNCNCVGGCFDHYPSPSGSSATGDDDSSAHWIVGFSGQEGSPVHPGRSLVRSGGFYELWEEEVWSL